MKHFLLAILSLVLITGCSLITKPSNSESKKIDLYYDHHAIADQKCIEMGTVIGSEGHWFSFFLISNKGLMQAAVSDIKNQAQALGANAVVLQNQIPFHTSVTILGTAYKCHINSK